MSALLDGTRDVRSLKGPRICSVGSGTAERLARYGVKADLIPDEFRGESLVVAMAETGSLDGAAFWSHGQISAETSSWKDCVMQEHWSPTSSRIEQSSKRRSRTSGPDVYRMLLDDGIDVVTFTSPSAVRNLRRSTARSRRSICCPARSSPRSARLPRRRRRS